MTIVLISSGVGRAKEDSFDVKAVVDIYVFLTICSVGTEIQLTTYMLLVFSEKLLENRPANSASNV